MMNRSMWSRVVVFLLAVVLVASPAMAAGGSLRIDKEPGVFAALWEFLGSLVPTIEKARGSMDPNGSPTTEARGSMDPDGQPASSTAEDDGDAHGTMDPDG
jgi:hypothetical protein